MGHWKQNQRRGSAPPGGTTPAPTVILEVAEVVSLDGQLDVTFSHPVVAGDFTPALFSDSTLGVNASSVAQQGAAVLRYFAGGWAGNSLSGDDWSYFDVVAGVTTPQFGHVA